MEFSGKRAQSRIAALIGRCLPCLLLIASSNAYSADEPTKPSTNTCKYVNIASLPVILSGTRPLVNSSINGHPIKMLVDTGAASSMISHKAADNIGLKLGSRKGTAFGVGGNSDIYETRVEKFEFGRTTWNDIGLDVTSDLDHGSLYSMLFGDDVLFSHDLEISLAEGQIRFFKPKDCQDEFLGYWGENVSYVPYRGVMRRGEMPIFNVEINGKRVKAAIDSGTPYTTIDLDFAKRVGITPTSPGVVESGRVGGIGKHVVNLWCAPFESFTIGGETIKNPKILIMDMWGSAQNDAITISSQRAIQDAEPSVLLGSDFLRTHRVLFSLSQQRLYFSYLGGTVFSSGEDMPATPKNEASQESP